MFWFCSGQILLASAYFISNLDLSVQARLFKNPDTWQSKILNHELVLDYYDYYDYSDWPSDIQ